MKGKIIMRRTSIFAARSGSCKNKSIDVCIKYFDITAVKQTLQNVDSKQQ